MKFYERQTSAQVLMPLLPVMVRVDGKGFSKFTQGLERPFDSRFSDLMQLTAKALLLESKGLTAYTQSDEINILLYSDSVKKPIYFNGRIQKIVGDLAALASITFYRHLAEYLPEKKLTTPRFDCRVWSLPTKEEAAAAFLWRELDATKNSISMAARVFYEHEALLGKSLDQMQELLFEKSVNWNDYPAAFKRGSFFRRLPQSETIESIQMPPFSKVSNKVEVLFAQEKPKAF